MDFFGVDRISAAVIKYINHILCWASYIFNVFWLLKLFKKKYGRNKGEG